VLYIYQGGDQTNDLTFLNWLTDRLSIIQFSMIWVSIRGVTAPAQLSSKELFGKLFREALSWWVRSFELGTLLTPQRSCSTSWAPLKKVFRTALLSWAGAVTLLVSILSFRDSVLYNKAIKRLLRFSFSPRHKSVSRF